MKNELKKNFKKSESMHGLVCSKKTMSTKLLKNTAFLKNGSGQKKVLRFPNHDRYLITIPINMEGETSTPFETTFHVTPYEEGNSSLNVLEAYLQNVPNLVNLPLTC